MERIHTSHAARSKLINTVCDPSCAIACDNPDAGFLLFRKLFIELSENRFAMAVGSPYDGIRIMVHNHCDVLVAFTVAGLIYAYMDKPIKPFGKIWFYIIKASAYAVTDCLPVNPHVLGNGAPWKIRCKLCHGTIKVLCEMAVMIGSWHCCRYNAVLRTHDTVSMGFYLNKHASEIKVSPDHRRL